MLAISWSSQDKKSGVLLADEEGYALKMVAQLNLNGSLFFVARSSLSSVCVGGPRQHRPRQRGPRSRPQTSGHKQSTLEHDSLVACRKAMVSIIVRKRIDGTLSTLAHLDGLMGIGNRYSFVKHPGQVMVEAAGRSKGVLEKQIFLPAQCQTNSSLFWKWCLMHPGHWTWRVK